MAAVDIGELGRNTSKVVGDVVRRNRPTIITRGGRPVAALIPIDADALEDWILAKSPEFVRGMHKADQELRLGETVGMDKAFGTLGQKVRRARRGAAAVEFREGARPEIGTSEESNARSSAGC